MFVLCLPGGTHRFLEEQDAIARRRVWDQESEGCGEAWHVVHGARHSQHLPEGVLVKGDALGKRNENLCPIVLVKGSSRADKIHDQALLVILLRIWHEAAQRAATLVPPCNRLRLFPSLRQSGGPFLRREQREHAPHCEETLLPIADIVNGTPRFDSSLR